MDLLGFGRSDAQEIAEIFRNIMSMTGQADGLEFDVDALTVGPIRALDRYGGLAVKCTAWLDRARISVHIDIGFGDVITPEAESVDFPALLPDFEAPRIRAYPVYTAMAEKIEAAVRLGENNTRMKDFFDLWFMATKFDVNIAMLTRAVRATFERRGTPLPEGTMPYPFTQELAVKKEQTWKQFLTRNGLQEPCGSFASLIEFLAGFLQPVF